MIFFSRGRCLPPIDPWCGLAISFAQRLDTGQNLVLNVVIPRIVSNCRGLNSGSDENGTTRLTKTQAQAANIQAVSIAF